MSRATSLGKGSFHPLHSGNDFLHQRLSGFQVLPNPYAKRRGIFTRGWCQLLWFTRNLNLGTPSLNYCGSYYDKNCGMTFENFLRIHTEGLLANLLVLFLIRTEVDLLLPLFFSGRRGGVLHLLGAVPRAAPRLRLLQGKQLPHSITSDYPEPLLPAGNGREALVELDSLHAWPHLDKLIDGTQVSKTLTMTRK